MHSSLTGRGRRRVGSTVITLMLAAALSACAVGPDFKPPTPPREAGYTRGPLPKQTAASPTRGGQTQRFIEDLDIPADWWSRFQSPALDRLIDQALLTNPDVAAAQAALQGMNETVEAARGALFPMLIGAIQPERERLNGAIIGEPQYTPTFSVITSTLQIGYAPDVFGGTHRQIESLAARAESERFVLEATYLTLTANVALAAIEQASVRGQIDATRQLLRIEGDELNLVRERFRVGVSSQADVLLQQTVLEQTRALLPPLQKQLDLTTDQLTALAGRLPSQQISESFSLDALSLPTDLPISLPARLVEQRPDVRSAQALLHAASANVGIATAHELPQFSITAQFGAAATGFSNYPGTGIWSLAGSISQTLFDAGTLAHQKRAALAALDEANDEYRSIVLQAFRNVADVLKALQSDADDLNADAAAERAASATLDVARRQFQAQTADNLTVLAAERAWQQTRLSRIQAEANRYADTVALFQALGGGWWHRRDVQTPP